MNPKVIAGCLSEEEIRGLKEMFKSMDADNSGTITVDELRRGLAKQGTKLSEAEVEQLMAAVSFVLVFFFHTRAARC
jgi:calcium-dependent protein kinase